MNNQKSNENIKIKPEIGKLHSQGPNFSFLKTIISLIGLAGVAYTTFGYGISLGIADALHIGYGQVTTSAYDAISLGWIAYIALPLEKLTKLNITSAFEANLYASILIAVITSTLYFGKILLTKFPQLKQKFFCTISHLKIPDDTKILDQNGFIHFLRGGLYVAFLSSLPAICMIFLQGMFVLLISIPFFAAYIGLSAGVNYVQDFIIKPEVCTPLQNREQRLKTPSKELGQTVKCSSISSYDGKFIAKGREVISNSEFILLYQPDTGKALRVGLKDQPTIITSVDSL